MRRIAQYVICGGLLALGIGSLASGASMSAADEKALAEMVATLRSSVATLEGSVSNLEQQRLPAIVEKGMGISTNEAVCHVVIPLDMGEEHWGSGTLIGISGDRKRALVMTCAHLFHRGPGSRVFHQGRCFFRNVPHLKNKPFRARLLRFDDRCDLAALEIEWPGIPPAVIGDLIHTQDGLYHACGYGHGRYSVARGKVFARGEDWVRTRTGIWDGHSGGGLFDPNMAWVGVCSYNGGSKGPNLGDFAGSASGWPLAQFLQQTTKQCGFFTRIRDRLGRARTCRPGEDCGAGGDTFNQPPAAGGGGYAQLAPGYQDITPGAQPAQQAAPLVQQAGGATPIVVTPAPVATSDPYRLQATPAQPSNIVQVAAPAMAPALQAIASPDPITAYIDQLQRVVEADRQAAAAKAAVAAYREVLSGGEPKPAAAPIVEPPVAVVDPRDDAEILRRLEAIEEKLAGPATIVDDDTPAEMIERLPVVIMKVRYDDREETAEVNLANFVKRKFLGAVADE